MISFIICSITPSRYSAVCRNLGALVGAEPHEFIGIHDARSLAEGYNRGVERSRGDVLVFCHDDIEVLAADFRVRLLQHMARFDLVGVAGSSRFVGPKWVDAGPPHIFGQVAHPGPDGKGFELAIWGIPARRIEGICLLDGVFMAARRSLCESVRFDEERFDGFHLYDLDFSLRAAQAGYRVAVCNDLAVLHHSRGSFTRQWEEYASRLMAKHGALADPVPREEKWSAWCPMQVRVETREALARQFGSVHWEE